MEKASTAKTLKNFSLDQKHLSLLTEKKSDFRLIFLCYLRRYFYFNDEQFNRLILCLS